jgi:2,2-dialkylglycine decarboxylase (pyruvate)
MSRRGNAMIDYGVDFVPEVINRGKGSYIYTEAGRKILDWTSGQVGES